MTFEIVLFIIGCLWAVSGLVIKTSTLLSSLIFKVMPFGTGMFVVFYSAKAMMWL